MAERKTSRSQYPALQNDEKLPGGPPIRTSNLIRVRRSKVHGAGVFAVAPIKKGTRIIEYLGDRVSHAEADRRYDEHDINDNHTFLFIVSRRTVIDAGVNGNAARFINHQCAPNCESVVDSKLRRVFIDAIRDIKPGEELGYDYQIGRERGDPPNVDEIYACRCGAAKCRGTMLWPPKRSKPRIKPKASPNRYVAAAATKRATRRKKPQRA